MKGIFITGTDTNIGKTTVSAAFFHRYRQAVKLCYWKPVQTGFPEDDDTATVRALGRCSSDEICEDGVRLARPLSPHLSAEYSGEEIDMARILRVSKVEISRGWIVEGAGGVLVPLNRHQFMIDLIAALALPTLVVARSQLGTINHTLLTISALRARMIPVIGVVLCGERNADNRRSIETYGNVPVLGELPPFTALTEETLSEWSRHHLDPEGQTYNAFAEAP
jgi:dethiobiotin synthetase